MRLLYFNVNAQKIEKDPNCDFTKLVSGTSGYLKAHFTFSSEWEGCVKIARFWRGKQEHAVLLQNDECDIPTEALVGSTFRVSVLGQREDYRITTNEIPIRQEVCK